MCEDEKDPMPALQLGKSREGNKLCLPSAQLAGSLSAKPLSCLQQRSFWTLPQAGPGGPKEMGVEYDPLLIHRAPISAWLVSPHPPRWDVCLLAILIVPSHPHGAVGPCGTQTAAHLSSTLSEPLSSPLVEASSSSRELPFHPLPSLLRTKLCSELPWLDSCYIERSLENSESPFFSP